MFEELRDANRKVVGLKQVLRELQAGGVCRVYLADDAEEHLKQRVSEAAADAEVELVCVATMEELGGECGIDVSAACAGILNR